MSKVTPLVVLARQKCVDNAHAIVDIGATPYHLIEPVLKKKTAKALAAIEKQSTQILPYTGPLWQNLIEKEFPDRPLTQFEIIKGQKGQVHPRKLYWKYFEERELQRKQATQALKQIARSINKEKEKHKIRTLDHVITPPRRMPSRSSGGFKPINPPTFKSSLLEKARHQNKIRSRFLAAGRRKQPSFGQVRPPVASQVVRTPTTKPIVRPVMKVPVKRPAKKPFVKQPVRASLSAKDKLSVDKRKRSAYIYEGK